MFSGQAEIKKKHQFLEQTKQARQERALERRREQAAVCIQADVRGFLTRQRLSREVRAEVDQLFPEDVKSVTNRPLALDVFTVLKKFFMTFHEEDDHQRFKNICRHVVASMDDEGMKYCYVSVTLAKQHTLQWIRQIKILLGQCCRYLQNLKPESPNDIRSIMLHLHTLVTFTSTNTWKIFSVKSNESLKPVMNQLCSNIMGQLVTKGLYTTLQQLLLKGLARTVPSLKGAALSAVINLAVRPMVAAQFSDNLVTQFVVHVLAVPALVLHLSTKSPECLALFVQHDILMNCISLLCGGQQSRAVMTTLEGGCTLSLIGNLIHLAYLEKEMFMESSSESFMHPSLLDFINVMIRLLECCQSYVVSKQSNLTHWHPVLGWFAQQIDSGLHEAVPFIKKQLQLLWSVGMLEVTFSSLLQIVHSLGTQNDQNGGSKNLHVIAPTSITSPSKASNFLKKALEKASSKNVTTKYLKLGSGETTTVAIACSLYQMALATFTQLRLDILTGLCYQDVVLPNLWKFICCLGPNYGLKSFLDHLAINTKTTAPEFQMLMLFYDCCTHLITILDDMELYEQQKPFRLEDLVIMSAFLNQFVFKIIWHNLIEVKAVNNSPFFNSVHTLLMLLYQRDCRRKYTPEDHWLIKEIRPSSFISDLEKGRKSAQILLQKVPHIVPHKERVLLFRKYISNEKAVLGLTESACASPQSTLVTVHRSRIVEDGYRQLAVLPPQALKGVIRVKFVNEQGLDEAGIDQDGVFKEFLEETIKKVFNPSLNLFKVTSEERLYPSPTSHIQENHLQLFEFVGRMLGKAVYEGIVVDVPFASFFLSQVLGHQHSALYSSIDELPSLDPDLYKSLTYIKHYDGDVRDLDLTFSYDDDCMGQVVTHELIPGGRAVPVTNENKISYIHLMAHFRMHVQINEQTAAFIRGFRSIIHHEWLAIFSTPEVQRLISGDTMEVELDDLRKHTRYYGGFHDNHRVIGWLWDILDKDFSPQERSLFLKFVTSCSKPPLLGFAHLDPPFSIRCVEVSDDQDTGDTVGSVLRGFFAVRKKDPVNRLPTSSTCFNLLKLPNYQKKGTLREKLRYAITSNTGFELS